MYVCPQAAEPKGEAREQEAWGAPVREGQQGSPQAVGQGPRGAGRQMTASSCRREVPCTSSDRNQGRRGQAGQGPSGRTRDGGGEWGAGL